MNTRANGVVAGVLFVLCAIAAPRDAAAQQTDCSKKAQRYADLEAMSRSCQPRVGADRAKCDAKIRSTRATLDNIYATQCGGAGGSTSVSGGASGPITAGSGATPEMQQVASQLNGVMGALQAQQDAKDAQAAAERAEAARLRKEEREEEKREAAAERAARAARMQAELADLAGTFNLAPASPSDPAPNTRAARDICRQSGSFIEMMNKDRYMTLCKTPEPSKPTGSGPAPVPLDVKAPATTNLWTADVCGNYAKHLREALIAVAKQHNADDQACRSAIEADPPAWRPIPHDCAGAHAPGMKAVSETMHQLAAAALTEINRQYALPMKSRKGCTQYLWDVNMAADAVSYAAEWERRYFATPVPPNSRFPPDVEECQVHDGAYRDMSEVAPTPDAAGVCRSLEAYWSCAR